MISIAISNATLILGSHTIFRDLIWEIQDDQRIGLIGPNGAGKSSLLKLIVGEHAPEPGGSIIKAKGVTLGYLPQQPEFDPDDTTIHLALSGNPRVAEIENEFANIEARLGDPSVYGNPKALTRTLESQQKYLEEYEALGGATYASRVHELLRGLGLEEADFRKPVRLLSGGQKKLIGLARLILAEPTVLLLDEPDNHLDLAGKNFLEGLIYDYPGAVVLISHDRYLLDAAVTHIAEIEGGRLTTFVGNYTEYILDKEKHLARQEELFQIQRREIARLEMAAKRFKLWTQFNDKFASRLHAMEARIQRIQKIDKPKMDRRTMDLNFQGWRGSNQVLEIKDLSVAFQDRRVLQGIQLLIRHGERVGLIGANGAGKSILLRLILGLEAPDAGEIKIGPSIKVGYYAQEHETLDTNQTLIEAVRHAGTMNEHSAVSFLIRYLFSYQQATLPISSLSGGERSRLQLAMLVLSGANFLLLDEPTNNLDIPSAELLENALGDFEGTVLVISHDRYFLDRTVNKILLLEAGAITEYVGGYSDYAQSIAGFS
jgi:ATP-binding cassette, subfamily F, member 3